MARLATTIDSSTQTVGEILRKPYFYKVPDYQRNFAWTDEEVSTLWEDLIRALEDDREEYFLGAMVLTQGDENKTLEIVDGQQRLAAVSMIFAAIAAEWSQLGDDGRYQDVFRDYLGTKDRRSGDIFAKLSLNELNDDVYLKTVVDGREVSGVERKMWIPSNKLLYAAVETFRKSVSTWLGKTADVESALVDLEEFIANKVNLIVIRVADDSDAFVIFETLNDRGLDLAVSDLVKNYLFSKADRHIELFKRSWNEISFMVGGDNVTQFLRHFWLSEHGLVRERELYRTLRNSVRSPAKARRLMERLKVAANLYSAMMNPDHEFWSDYPVEARGYLESLKLFKVTQYRPVALAAMEKLKPIVVTRVLHMLMVISFRYTVISSLGTGNLEKTYSDAAVAIRDGKSTKPLSIFRRLKSAYVEDSRFKRDFAAKNFTKANIARYVLAELNDKIEADPTRITERAGALTLEHILPKNPSKGWKGAVPKGEEASKYGDFIGNLTLLEKGKNRGIANALFSKKREKAYSISNLALNTELVALGTWTHDTITKRSRRLARIAASTWRLDH